jgi:ketosteroid isomerase-like protein
VAQAYHAPVNRSDVQVWLDRYIEAWRQNDPELVEALFTADAVYRFRPYGGEGRVAEGVADIVSSWIDVDDDPGKWEAGYEPFAVEGERAVAVGTSRYFGAANGADEVYHNCFLLRFTDGRCAEFTEYWMLEPTEG